MAHIIYKQLLQRSFTSPLIINSRLRHANPPHKPNVIPRTPGMQSSRYDNHAMADKQNEFVDQIEPTPQYEPDDLIHKLNLECSSHELQVLDSYQQFVEQAAEHLGITRVGTYTPEMRLQRRTLLKSRFVHKDHRVQYEWRAYQRHMIFEKLTGSTADTFLEYVQRNMPETVFMIVVKHKLGKLNISDN